jgi:hypothetical protein
LTWLQEVSQQKASQAYEQLVWPEREEQVLPPLTPLPNQKQRDAPQNRRQHRRRSVSQPQNLAGLFALRLKLAAVSRPAKRQGPNLHSPRPNS